MLTNWLTFTAFLAASANTERAAIGRGTLTIAPTHRVTGHPELQLTLTCGDGRDAGAVHHWHTPFGDIHTPGSHGKTAPVILQRDGSLTIPDTSSFHRGVYYCLLRNTKRTTLWPYDLHVDGGYQRSDAFRFRRDVGSEEQTQAGVSHGHFAGAVAASVLLTFVVGFSAGALTRTPVLRCLRAVTTRLRSPRQHHHRTDMPVGGSKVTMTTKPLTFNNQAIGLAQGSGDDSAACAMAETSSSTHTSSNGKPQRSFKQKQNTRDVEGWDQNNGCDGERAFGGYYLENEGGACKTEDSKHIQERKEARSQGEEAGDEDNRTNENGGQKRASSEEKGSAQEEIKDRAKRREEDGETDKGNEDSETSSNTQEGGGARSSPLPGRRRRVIRLYQYDEEGQRYGHLPDATAAPEPDPAPRLKQRSQSLTRLNAIMAAASAGPLTQARQGRRDHTSTWRYKPPRAADTLQKDTHAQQAVLCPNMTPASG